MASRSLPLNINLDKIGIAGLDDVVQMHRPIE
jgi:hypothetical protein